MRDTTTTGRHPVPPLSAVKFTYENWIGRQAYSLDRVWNPETNRPQNGFSELGRCDARRLKFRAKKAGEAVMLFDESNNKEFWLHVVNDKAMAVDSSPKLKTQK